MKRINVYKILLEFPLNQNIESYLYSNDVHIIEEYEYGVIEIWVASELNDNELLELVGIKKILVSY